MKQYELISNTKSIGAIVLNSYDTEEEGLERLAAMNKPFMGHAAPPKGKFELRKVS